jgi:hypothetical protein
MNRRASRLVALGVTFASALLVCCASHAPPSDGGAPAAGGAAARPNASSKLPSVPSHAGGAASGDHRQTGRGWLVGNQLEPSGYGLYSYLLFGSRPSDATRPLYVAVIKARLGKVDPIERQLSEFHPAQLNLYLVPLLGEPPGGAESDRLANWIVDYGYNYPRASKILTSLAGRRTGVYILSVLSKPVDPSHALQPPYLWQDLSSVEPAIVVAWIQYFLDQSAKDRPWEESMGDKLALDLRNNIEIVAVQMQAAIPAMATAVKWFKLES